MSDRQKVNVISSTIFGFTFTHFKVDFCAYFKVYFCCLYGLIEAMVAIPNAEHRYCCSHIKNNMIKKFDTSQLRGMFWVVDETSDFNNFKNIMVMIKQFNIEHMSGCHI